MEDTRNNQGRYGMPMLRERSGHENVEDLFSPRRERQFHDGLLGAAGYNSKYLLFRPSSSFVRDFGDVVLRLNMALYEFRRLSADHALLLDGDRLQAHYDELNGRVDKTRDRLVVLMDYCNKGFDGNWEETLDGTWPAADAPPNTLAEDGDVFDSTRRRGVESDLLTEAGREAGWVALRPCPFYGRLMGEIICTFNDALIRAEARMGADIEAGKAREVRQYRLELRKGMTALRADVEAIIEFCQRKVA